MENKILHNLEKIVLVKIGKKQSNLMFSDYQEKGWRWWKFLGFIPLFKYYISKSRYRYIMDWVNEDEVSSVEKHCYSENGIVYWDPYIYIYFWDDVSITKYFKTVEELDEYANKLLDLCKEKNIFIENLKNL